MSEQYPPIPSLATGGSVEVPAGAEQYYPPTVGASGGRPGGPSGDDGGAKFNRQKFVKSYANLVAQTWVDDSLLQLILVDPAETLSGWGMPTIPGAVFRIVQCKLTGMGKIEDQVEAWVEGNRSGLYDLFLPMKPDEMDISPSGGAGSAEGGVPCCCCSPCCCCGSAN